MATRHAWPLCPGALGWFILGYIGLAAELPAASCFPAWALPRAWTAALRLAAIWRTSVSATLMLCGRRAGAAEEMLQIGSQHTARR